MRAWLAVFLLTVGITTAQAQTETPTPTMTPTVTATPTNEPYVYATLPAPTEGATGQMSRFDYVASAGDVYIASLLTVILLSMWGFFLFWVFFGRNR